MQHILPRIGLIFILLLILFAGIPIPAFACIALACLAVIAPAVIFMRFLKQTDKDSAWHFRAKPRNPWKIEGVAVRPEFFLGSKRVEGFLRIASEQFPATQLRSLPSGMLLSAAIALMADSATEQDMLQELLAELHLDAAAFCRKYPVLHPVEVRGIPGKMIQDGKSQRAFFLLDRAQYNQRVGFLTLCTKLQSGRSAVPMTESAMQHILSLPADALLLVTASESELPSQMTFLGALTMHSMDTASPAALEAFRALDDAGLPLYYLVPGESQYNPVQVLGLEIPECRHASVMLIPETLASPETLTDAAILEAGRRKGLAQFCLVTGICLLALALQSACLGSRLPALLPALILLLPQLLLLNQNRPADTLRTPWQALPALLPGLLLSLFGRMILRTLTVASGTAELAVFCMCTVLAFSGARGCRHRRAFWARCLSVILLSGTAALFLLFRPAWDAALFAWILGILSGILTLRMLPRTPMAASGKLFTSWMQLFTFRS